MAYPHPNALAYRMYSPKDVPELTGTTDWSAWPVEKAYAGIIAFGWAESRLYPNDVLFQRWLNCLLPLGIRGEPLDESASDEEILAHEDRVPASIRHYGLRWVGGLIEIQFNNPALGALCHDTLNSMQGTAMCMVEAIEGIRYDGEGPESMAMTHEANIAYAEEELREWDSVAML